MSVPIFAKTREKQRGWRRRHPRHRADFPVKLTALRDDGYEEVSGRCSDLSHGGLGAVLTCEITSGEVVSVEFTLPSSPAAVSVRAIVRYQRGFAHGLEFLSPSTDLQQIVDSFCASLETID